MAIRTVEHALESLGPPLYVFHQIVHNRHVVRQFEQRGVRFVDSLDEVPAGANLLYSAHGVSPLVREIARSREFNTIDATCPLVAKVHLEAARYARMGFTIVLIGHAGHDEVVGTAGEAPGQIRVIESCEDVARLHVPDPDKVAWLCQTTLSIDDVRPVLAELQRRFPAVQGPASDDICYATQNRQEAVRELAGEADLVLVVGSANSSNSIRLTEVARQHGVRSYLVDNASELQPDWFDGVETVVVTAGASAPEHLVQECLGWLIGRYGAKVEPRTVRQEDVVFPLPRPFRSQSR
jgi:4-hydroxy-3-methylbut-2-enyl diphosphate reductase